MQSVLSIRSGAIFKPMCRGRCCFMNLVALAWATLQRRWSVLLVGLWTGIMASLVAGRLIGLPGANYLQSFALMIALYIPTGLLCGWLISEAAGPVVRRWSQFGPPLVSSLLLGLALWGAKGSSALSVLNT